MSEAISTIPYRIFNPLFLDSFKYRGAGRWPGSETLPEHWGLVSGSATTNSETHLEFLTAGEIDYIGDNLEDIDLNTIEDNTYANYAISAEFYADTGMDFSLRSRSLGSSVFDCVELRVDVGAGLSGDNGRFKLIESIESTSTECDYGWTEHKLDIGTYYTVCLWCYRNFYYVYINGYLAQSETAAEGSPLYRNTGFGIWMHGFNSDAKARFREFKVQRLIEPSTPSLEGNESDLYVQFRKQMQQQLAGVTVGDWESFKAAHKLYTKYKGYGRSNNSWWHFGYPIREPMTEEWYPD